jgi:ketosteroid isomerase-like protein
MRLVGRRGEIRLLTVNTGVDQTERLRAYAARRVEELAREGLSGYVLKQGSPSCGMERVRVYSGRGPASRSGSGLFAARLMARLPHLPIEEEGRLSDPGLRENFIERVFAYRRLHELFVDGRIEEAASLLDPDIDWLEPEEQPDRRVVKGSEAARGALMEWLEAWQGYEIDLVEAVDAPGDRVFQAVRQRATGAGSGVPFEGDLFQVWELRDGRPVRMEMFFDRAKALAAAGLS